MKKKAFVIFSFISFFSLGSSAQAPAASARPAEPVHFSAEQDHQRLGAAENGPMLTKLSTPIYPPLAKAAHVEGDVEVEIKLGREGKIESVRATYYASPLLSPAALESARKSEFACRNCDAELTPYTLRYSFHLLEPDCSREENLPTVKMEMLDSVPHITVSSKGVMICDPVVTVRKVRARSPKCLYLWRCKTAYPE
jgi:hypothetical protein